VPVHVDEQKSCIHVRSVCVEVEEDVRLKMGWNHEVCGMHEYVCVFMKMVVYVCRCVNTRVSLSLSLSLSLSQNPTLLLGVFAALRGMLASSLFASPSFSVCSQDQLVADQCLSVVREVCVRRYPQLDLLHEQDVLYPESKLETSSAAAASACVSSPSAESTSVISGKRKR
jgi:hypothetical protein